MNFYDNKKNVRILKQLVKRGYEEDEIRGMFKTEEELAAFYADLKKAETTESDEADAEDGETPVDDFKLPADEAKRLLRDDKESKQEEQRIKFDSAVADNAEPTSEAKVSYDDFLKSVEEGMSADDTGIPDN